MVLLILLTMLATVATLITAGVATVALQNAMLKDIRNKWAIDMTTGPIIMTRLDVRTFRVPLMISMMELDRVRDQPMMIENLLRGMAQAIGLELIKSRALKIDLKRNFGGGGPGGNYMVRELRAEVQIVDRDRKTEDLERDDDRNMHGPDPEEDAILAFYQYGKGTIQPGKGAGDA